MTNTTQASAPGTVYRGRFAPSPTGPLHRGSLVAALASYLQARVNNGTWLLRIEDIDPPREVSGASQAIVASLDAHGFEWDGDILYQSVSNQRFAAIVESLLTDGRAYACTCSREQIRQIARRSATGFVYPGTCRDRGLSPETDRPSAIRIRTCGATVAFVDLIQGHVSSDVENDIGDFVIRRKDGLVAYSLAVVVDDYEQGITEVVRGVDLLAFTPAQIMLQRALGYPQPVYCHVPLVTTSAGEKLSKQTGAMAIDDTKAAVNLVEGLRHLRQNPPDSLMKATVDDVWDWARNHWRLDKLVIRAANANR